MTPGEIRAHRPTSLPLIARNYLVAEAIGIFLREIAAQLAEQNEEIRKDREFRQIVLNEERTERHKRDELLATSAQGIEAFRKSVEAPPQFPPRVVFPGEVVHLGCLIREPDGTHAIANEAGLTRLDPDFAQRILAAIAPPGPEGKPQ